VYSPTSPYLADPPISSPQSLQSVWGDESGGPPSGESASRL